MRADVVLGCEALRKTYGDRVAVDGVGFSIAAGETYAARSERRGQDDYDLHDVRPALTRRRSRERNGRELDTGLDHVGAS